MKNPELDNTLDIAEIEMFEFDWKIYQYDGWNLTLGASNSLAYGHTLELRFCDTTYINCPTEFYCPKFRIASETELTNLVPFLDMSDRFGMIIDAESSNSISKIPFLVCAGSYTIQWNNVSYISASEPE